jgi:hypothetical protein
MSWRPHPLEPAEGLEVQVHHLISLGGWNDVTDLSIYPIPLKGVKITGCVEGTGEVIDEVHELQH